MLFGHGAKAATSRAPEVSSSSGELVDEGAGTGERRAREAEAPRGASNTATLLKPKGGHHPGTGRLEADAYAGATRVACHHEELAVGERCPACGQGTLYALPPGVEIRIDGQALLSAIRYEVAKLRCSACGQMFTAGLPAGVGEAKYSPQARAVLAVGRYFLGLPLYRIAAYQAMLGVPVPDATQWDQIEQVGDCAYVVFAQMEQMAAQGALIFQDDTAVRILSLIQENIEIVATAQAQALSTPKARIGMHTTALVVQVGEHTAILAQNQPLNHEPPTSCKLLLIKDL